MKKMIYVVLLVLLFLTGCGKDDKGTAVTYMNGNAEVLKASTQIDTSLLKELKKVKKSKFDNAKVMNDIKHAKDLQQGFYDQLMEEPISDEYSKVKISYLNLVNSRIDSYNELIKAVEENDIDTLKSVVEKHITTDENVMAKTLVDVNSVAEKLGEKTKKELFSSTKK